MTKTPAERKREQRLRDKEKGLLEMDIKVSIEDKELISKVGIQKILQVYKNSLSDLENSENSN